MDMDNSMVIARRIGVGGGGRVIGGINVNGKKSILCYIKESLANLIKNSSTGVDEERIYIHNVKERMRSGK